MTPALTAAQLLTLKADLAANTNPVTINGASVAVSAVPHGPDNANQIVQQWYNLLAAVDFFANFAAVPVADILNAVTWKNYTPADAPPVAAVPSAPTAAETYALSLWTARSLCCQGYQFNVQTMLTGRASFDATKANLYAGLKDATNTNMPSGLGGANNKGGWLGVQGVLCRKCTNAEKLLADTAAGNGAAATTAATCTAEGQLTAADILNAWGA